MNCNYKMKSNRVVKIEVLKYFKGGKRRPQILYRHYENGQIIEFQMKTCGKKSVCTRTLKF